MRMPVCKSNTPTIRLAVGESSRSSQPEILDYAMRWSTKVSLLKGDGEQDQLLGCPLISTHGIAGTYSYIQISTYIIHTEKIRKQVFFFKLVDRDQ